MTRFFARLGTSLFMGAVAAAIVGSAATAQAQGFGVYEQGTCMMGRAGAGVAAPCDDGSSLFFNPAGMVDTKQASIGVTGIRPTGDFTNSSTGAKSSMNAATYPVPAAYITFPVTKTITGGLAVYAPYGLAADWPSSSEGRYVGYYSSIKSVYIQPSYGVRISKKITMGVGFAFSRTSLSLQKRADLSTLALPGSTLTFGAIGVPKGTDFADIALSGDKITFGTNIGVIIKPNDMFSLGVRYLSKQTVSIKDGQETISQINTGLNTRVALPGIPAGTPIDTILKGSFAPGAALSNQSASTVIPLPMQLVGGIAVSPNKQLQIFADLQYTRWSSFDTVVITSQYAPQSTLYERYNDVVGVRVGGEYKMMEGRGTLRFGINAHGPAAPDQTVTPVLPEAARKEFNVGAGFGLGPKARLDVAYMYLMQDDRAGRTNDSGAAEPTTALNNGTFNYKGNLFAAGIAFKF